MDVVSFCLVSTCNRFPSLGWLAASTPIGDAFLRSCEVCGDGFHDLDNFMQITVSIPGVDQVEKYFVHIDPCAEEVSVEGII